ncbi:MAG: poly-gamma-glutamate biosynthesis protein PgsC/CapC, partial [Candidatus Brocadiae bacterium]|nr:poly-gamma-glutamate biosynthesis protein PgsC/CapC [Candidatus Brocadiia bacterium]
MIPLFSPNGLQHSLVISVCIGVLITTLMFERYGWVFSGLVVPGYLAPIFAIYPLSGLTILLEAMLTIGVVRGIHLAAWRFRTHTPLFGRERFFLIVLIALGVRLLVEELLLPWGTEILFPGRTDILSRIKDFGAIGLVVVPLTANLLWKPGIPRGLIQVGVCTLGVLVALYGILMPLTNYNLAQLGAVYEDVSLNFSQSAKLQIMIVCGCLLAARMNLLEGWDFGGILLPPLIAISLLQPSRLIGTVLEVFLVVTIGRQVINLPLLNRITWAGPRLVTFCFTLCVVLKIALGWVIYFIEPQWNATDLLGFGYILSSLLACKLWNKSSRVTLWPTLYVSAATFLLGTTLSFALSSASRWVESDPVTAGSVTAPQEESHPIEFAVLERLSPGGEGAEGIEQSVGARRRMAEVATRALDDLRRGVPEGAIVARAAFDLAPEGLVTRWFHAPGSPAYMMIGAARPEESELETVFIRLGSGTRAMIVTPPGAEPLSTSLAVAALAKRLQPSVIVLSSGHPGADADAPPRFDSLVAWILTEFPWRPVLEIAGTRAAGAVLDIHGGLPEDGLSIEALRRILPGLEVRAPAQLSGARMRWMAANARGGYQRLETDLRSASALIVSLVPESSQVDEELSPLDRYLAPYLESMQLRRPGLVLSPAQWTKSRLIVLKTGLLRLAVAAQEASRSQPIRVAELNSMNFLARVLGLEFDLLREPGGDRQFLVLRNTLGEPEVDGVVVFQLGSWRELHVEVPSPRRFPNSHRLGLQVFLAGNCRALTIGGISSPSTGLLQPEVARALDRLSLFHLAHQVLVEQASVQGQDPPRVLQVRGRSVPETGNDGVLVPPDIVLPTAQVEMLEIGPWLRIFEDLGWTIRVQPPEEPDGFDTGEPLQARYRRFLRYEGISGLWADPDIRRALRGPRDDPAAVAALRQLGSADGGA